VLDQIAAPPATEPGDSRLHLQLVQGAPDAPEREVPRHSPAVRPLEVFKPTSVASLAVEVLRAAAAPLHVCDITAEVLALATARGIRLAGRTPVATVGLALRRVHGVERVGRGVYIWRGSEAGCGCVGPGAR
jgi:hypothetical protein